MPASTPAPADTGLRFPHEIIRHAVWRSVRFRLRYRDGEALLAARGSVVTSATVRHWGLNFGHTYANQLRRRRAPPGDTWHRDEVLLKITGNTHSLWRAVDQHGTSVDLLVQRRRTNGAAKTCFHKVRTGCTYVPGVISTDTRASSGAAQRACLPSGDHRHGIVNLWVETDVSMGLRRTEDY